MQIFFFLADDLLLDLFFTGDVWSFTIHKSSGLGSRSRPLSARVVLTLNSSCCYMLSGYWAAAFSALQQVLCISENQPVYFTANSGNGAQYLASG